MDPVGDWNQRQVFDARGVLFLIAQLDCGHYMVMKMVETDLPEGIVAAEHLDTPAEAVAEAERLRKAALI